MAVEEIDPTPKWLMDVHQFLLERFSERLTLSDLAVQAGVHPVYLSRVFRAYYGCSIGEYLTRCRLRLAMDLMTSTELSLAQIAIDTGFYDQGHFSNKFKKHLGISPREYRSRLQKDEFISLKVSNLQDDTFPPE